MFENLKQNEELWNLFTRKEEYNHLMLDRYERFPHYLSQYRNILEPEVSKFLIKNGLNVEYPDGKKFAVCLTHDIDIARYILGKEPIEVFSKSRKFRHSKEDHAIVVLDFGDTAVSIEVNWFTPHKVRKLVVTGSEGIANLDYIDQHIVIHNSEESIMPKIEKKEPLKLELEHFLYCVKNNKEPQVNGYDGMKTLEIALKASKE